MLCSVFYLLRKNRHIRQNPSIRENPKFYPQLFQKSKASLASSDPNFCPTFQLFYKDRTDALLFCENRKDIVQELIDVVDDQSQHIALQSFSTAVRADYPTNYTRLNFGGFSRETMVDSIIDKERVGNNMGLDMISMGKILDDIDANVEQRARWIIPNSRNKHNGCTRCNGGCSYSCKIRIRAYP